MVRGNRKSGGGSCCRGQRGGDAHRRQCGSGRKRQSAGDHCNGGHATTQSGGDAHRRQCGSGRKGKRGTRGKGKGKGRSRSRSRSRSRGKEDALQEKWEVPREHIPLEVVPVMLVQ